MKAHYVEGTYNVKCLECALDHVPGEGKKAGWPRIVLKIQVLDWVNEKDEFIPENKQYTRFIRLPIDPNSEDAAEEVMTKLRQAGWTGSQFETICEDMVGVSFAADCWHSENTWSKDPQYLGQMEENWGIWTPKKERKPSEPLKSNPAVAKSLNALFGKRLKEGVKKPDPPAETSVVAEKTDGRGDDEGPPPGALPDDEVPF